MGVLQAVSCPYPTTCLAVGGPTVLATTDGASWTVMPSPPQVFDLDTVSCRPTVSCLAAGSRAGDAGAMYATRNGGLTWRTQSAEVPGGFFLAVSCASRTACVATGNGGTVFSTVDGGRTWSGQIISDVSLINGIDCMSTTVCQAVAYSGRDGAIGVAMRTTDGGQTWVEHPLPPFLPFAEAVSCPSIDTCVAVGQVTIRGGSKQVGVIAATRDGGTTWRRQHVPAGYTNLEGIDCPAIDVCEAAGYGPRGMLGTVDGGATWNPQGPEGAIMRGISCPDPSTCVAVGQRKGDGRGAIYRTTTGGRAWYRQLG